MKSVVRCLVMLSLATLAVAQSDAHLTYGQAESQANVFTPVPEESRARLVERLKLYLEFYRTKQPDKLYELIDAEFLGGESKEEYVKWSIEHHSDDEALLDFSPIKVIYREGFMEWAIDGCARFRRDGEVSATIYAYLRNEEWYFTHIAVVIDKGKGIPCAQKAANNGMQRTRSQR